jgi:hypothetical protein
MIDFAEIASFAAMDWREERDQIDAMEKNTRFPAAEIEKRRGRLKIKARAVHVVRVVAETDAIRALVAQQLEAGAK